MAALPAFPEIRIRAYNEETDHQRADELEKICEVGPSHKVSLFTDLLGDPLCRIRHYPAYAMLVAEEHPGGELVGLIRAGLKEVVSGGKSHTTSLQTTEFDGNEDASDKDESSMFAPTAYILGLRVVRQYRRLGIGEQLVRKMEEWCRDKGARYVYIATEKDNEASVNLFTKKLGYAKFRTPAILVQPVYARNKKLQRKVEVKKLSQQEAAKLYMCKMQGREFFPKDIECVLGSKLNSGTWMATWKGDTGDRSRAVVSLWRCNDIFKLELRGVSLWKRVMAAASRAVGKLVSCAAVPTVPNVFKPFGLQLMYGLHAEGETGGELLRNLCRLAHNVAREEGCAVVAAEVGSCDPLRAFIPHWASASCDEDLWCLKRLAAATDAPPADQPLVDWCKLPPAASLFVDPRDF